MKKLKTAALGLMVIGALTLISLPQRSSAQNAPTTKSKSAAPVNVDILAGVEGIPKLCPDAIFERFVKASRRPDLPRAAFDREMQIATEAAKETLELRVQEALDDFPVRIRFNYEPLLSLLSNREVGEPGEEGMGFSLSSSGASVRGFEINFFELDVMTADEQVSYRLRPEQIQELRVKALDSIHLSHKSLSTIGKLEIKNTPITQVLESLCTQGELDFAMSATVVPMLSLRLRGQPIQSAITIAANAAGWDVEFQNSKALKSGVGIDAYEVTEIFANREWLNSVSVNPEDEVTDMMSALILLARKEAKKTFASRPVVVAKPSTK